jgi:hypothetical protein
MGSTLTSRAAGNVQQFIAFSALPSVLLVQTTVTVKPSFIETKSVLLELFIVWYYVDSYTFKIHKHYTTSGCYQKYIYKPSKPSGHYTYR